jgi:type II secretory pathway pseudopilin PulG
MTEQVRMRGDGLNGDGLNGDGLNGGSSDRAGRDGGFALFEALIALVIVSVGMTAFYLAIGGSYRGQARVKGFAATVEQARSQLDRMGTDAPLEEGTASGTYPGGAQWRATVTALDKPGTVDPLLRPAAYWVRLEVFDRRGVAVLQLETAKMGGAMP